MNVTKEQMGKLLAEFRQAAWESGWYAGAMEKAGTPKHSLEEHGEYSDSMHAAINRRTELRDEILGLFECEGVSK